MSRRLMSATAALFTALVITIPTSAHAEASPEPPAACTVGGVAVPDGAVVPEEIPSVVSCFESVAEAEQFIADGAPGDYEQLQPAGLATPLAAAATVTIGKVWTGTSRSGSVLIHWGSGTGCHGVTYGFPSLTSSWNNNIRSAEGFSNCWSSQYDGANYSGSVLTCAPYCSTLGSMAAKTSSIVYRPVGTFG